MGLFNRNFFSFFFGFVLMLAGAFAVIIITGLISRDERGQVTTTPPQNSAAALEVVAP